MIIKNLFLAFIFIVAVSCSDDVTPTENTVADTERKAGQIPDSVNFMAKINAAGDNSFAYIKLLKEIKKEYGDADFYNNLYEITSSYIYLNDDFEELDVSSYRFLLDENRRVASNLGNIKNLPLLLNQALKANVISNDEYTAIAAELISKNEKQLLSIAGKNIEAREEKLKEIQEAKNSLFYFRSRYLYAIKQ